MHKARVSRAMAEKVLTDTNFVVDKAVEIAKK
jgi:hypothetical protein